MVTDRSSEEAAVEAFNDFAEALGRYLDARGWTALVVGNPRIQKQAGARAFNFEFVVSFTGRKRQGGSDDEGSNGADA